MLHLSCLLITWLIVVIVSELLGWTLGLLSLLFLSCLIITWLIVIIVSGLLGWILSYCHYCIWVAWLETWLIVIIVSELLGCLVIDNRRLIAYRKRAEQGKTWDD